MTLWRYKAIRLQSRLGSGQAQACESSGQSSVTVGEMSGTTAAEVRASLRRIGMQVIDVRPIRAPGRFLLLSRAGAATGALADAWRRHLRARRRLLRSEFYDGLATMLESGLPLLEAVDALIGDGTRPVADWRAAWQSMTEPRRVMLLELREALRAGSALSEAMAKHLAWFDTAELAMIRAGQHNGDLAGVLRNLADRLQRSNELGQKLSSALAYPAIIAAVGLGVVIFLSVKTLPDLAAILRQHDVAVPVLTERIMMIGQLIARTWWMLLGMLAAVSVVAVMLPALTDRRGGWQTTIGTRGRAAHGRTWTPIPKVVRRLAVANISLRLSEMIQTGVPMIEALRVLAPTAQIPVPGGRRLMHLLHHAADEVERGEDLASSFTDMRWFDAEYTRLLAIGQHTGELHELLQRIGCRYQRQAARLIDRLASLLEPAVLLVLAALIGIVVMAAILPLIRLQEVLG